MLLQSTTVPARTAGVYEIEDLGNGRVYVGSSVDVAVRLRRHRHMLITGTHFCQHLQNAYRLRGAESFRFRIVLQTAPDACVAAETAWLQRYTSGQLYNRCMEPQRGVLGLHWTLSAETRAKQGAANRGRRASAETRERIRQAAIQREAWRTLPSQLGRTHSAETKAKIGRAQLGRRRPSPSPEQRQKLRAALLGRSPGPRSPETRQKMRDAQQARRVRERVVEGRQYGRDF